jgi:hypothetical protein
MEPLALAAVVGLVFAGKRLSDRSDEDPRTQAQAPPTTRPITRRDLDLKPVPGGDQFKDYFDLKIMTPDLGRRIGDERLQPKNEIRSLQDAAPTAGRSPFGQPVYDLYNRQNVTNKMNNLQPIERMHVGPGLGVDPSVPATGGFQDFFRVLPNNINEERLTTLEGRDGPPNPVVKNGGTVIGDITHQAKDSKAWNRPPAQNKGEGQGGALIGPEGRPDFLKTRRSTIRHETGMRTDGLENGPGQYNVAQPYAEGGDTCYTDKSLTRSSDLRGNPDRPGNAQRMNVRDDPVVQGGAATSLRSETTAFPVPHMNGGRFQNYQAPEFAKVNEKKSQVNPWSAKTSMDIAIQQLEKNPLAQTPLSAV